MTFGEQETSKLKANKAVSPVVAIFGLGGGEILLIVTLALILFGARTIPPMAKGLGAGIEQFKKPHRQPDYELRFDKKSLIDGITILLLMALAFTVLACLRFKGLL